MPEVEATQTHKRVYRCSFCGKAQTEVKTLVAGPGGELVVCRDGNVGLATSRSGDVLAGVVTGLLGRGAAPFTATCWGVHLHAKAGDFASQTIGPLGFLARELLPEIPRIMGDLS